MFDHITLNSSSFLLRVHGAKVAEIPLVATRFKFRRLGMCRILMEELEKVIFFLWIWGKVGTAIFRNFSSLLVNLSIKGNVANVLGEVIIRLL